MQKKYSEVKAGDVFTFGGQRWIKLEETGLCVMEDILAERVFDEDGNDWKKSKLRKYLNNDFCEMLTENGAKTDDFLMVETDLVADDGMKDYGTSEDLISLMTADLCRHNRHLLTSLKGWWWLATPHSCLNSHLYYVRCTTETGTFGSSPINCKYGVRPLCNLSPDTLVSVPGEETENATERIKRWVKDRGLNREDPKGQMVKLLEGLGELANGVNKERHEKIIDSIGDVYVGLTILSMQLDLDIESCIATACEKATKKVR